MARYYKEPDGRGEDSDGYSFDDGWCVFKQEGDEPVDLIAVVDTETLADLLIKAIEDKDAEKV